MGGVWVPVFPARDVVSGYVSAKGLKAPAGKEFLWMGHRPGAVFPLLSGIKCFAGVRLYLLETATVEIPWPEIQELARGRIPQEGPKFYELPVARLEVPLDARIVYGKLDFGPKEPQGRLLCLPQAGHFSGEDMRRLVQISLSQGKVWMACRHFIQVLRFLYGRGGDSRPYLEDLLCSLLGFRMYGEAEALCEWISRQAKAGPGILKAVLSRFPGDVRILNTLAKMGGSI
jgi:hypothetical protein